MPGPSADPKTIIASGAAPQGGGAPESILLVSYPKIVFMYPTFLAALAAAIAMSVAGGAPDDANAAGHVVSTIFLGVLAVNLVILSFDFPRTTSLTLFFAGAAMAMGLVLLFKFQPDYLPLVADVLALYHPLANATFYWTIVCVLGGIYAIVAAVLQFDYWEVRPNELLHHHGFLSNLERFAAPNLRIDKEINDLFEYLLLRSGRLILQPSNERRAIIIDNVPFIKRKEAAITRMLGALQVQVRDKSER